MTPEVKQFTRDVVAAFHNKCASMLREPERRPGDHDELRYCVERSREALNELATATE